MYLIWQFVHGDTEKNVCPFAKAAVAMRMLFIEGKTWSILRMIAPVLRSWLVLSGLDNPSHHNVGSTPKQKLLTPQIFGWRLKWEASRNKKSICSGPASGSLDYSDLCAF